MVGGNLDNLYHFFERQKRRFKRHPKYLLRGPCIQPKKQFKVQIIGILEEIHSFSSSSSSCQPTATIAMNVATAAPSGRENEAKNGMNAAGLGIPGIPKTKKKF